MLHSLKGIGQGHGMNDTHPGYCRVSGAAIAGQQWGYG